MVRSRWEGFFAKGKMMLTTCSGVLTWNGNNWQKKLISNWVRLMRLLSMRVVLSLFSKNFYPSNWKYLIARILARWKRKRATVNVRIARKKFVLRLLMFHQSAWPPLFRQSNLFQPQFLPTGDIHFVLLLVTTNLCNLFFISLGIFIERPGNLGVSEEVRGVNFPIYTMCVHKKVFQAIVCISYYSYFANSR